MKLSAIWVAILFCFSLQSFATSQQGGYITYENVGADSFLVTLVQYSECDALALFPASRTINVTSSCASLFTVQLYKTQHIPIISNTCDSIGYRCSGPGPGPLGLVKHTYNDTVTLPQPCHDWTFSYSSCCRPTVMNFKDLNGNMTQSVINISSRINTLLSPSGSSPQILNPANAYVLSNQWNTYNANALDFDGNNLSYSFYTPLVQPGVNYFQLDSLSIDSNNGDIFYLIDNSSSAEIFIFQKIIELTPSGDTLGYVEHEFRFSKVNNTVSANTPPDEPGDLMNLSGAQLQSGNELLTCPGNTICFDIQLSDVDQNQEVHVNDSLLQTSLPGAAINKTGINPAVLNVCWQVPPGMTGTRNFCGTTFRQCLPNYR